MKKAGVQAGPFNTSKDTMSITHDTSAAPPAGAEGLRTPDDVRIVQSAHGWNAKRKAKIGSEGQDRTRASSDLRTAERQLAEDCDRAVRKSGAQP